MLGDKQAHYILQHMVHKYDHRTSKVLAEAYNQQVPDFTTVMPPLPSGSRASDSPFVPLDVIDSELTTVNDPLLDAIIKSARTSLESIVGNSANPILPPLNQRGGGHQRRASEAPRKVGSCTTSL